MARMFPASLDQAEIRSRAETVLYGLFQGDLNDEFTVIHGARWYLPASMLSSTGGNGEADFIILHPRLGILVIEAKSGTLQYSAATGKWTIDGGNGQPKRSRRGPLEQAESNRHALEAALRRAFPEMPRVRFTFAVAMPECTYDDALEHVGLPRALFLDSHECSRIEVWVRAAYSHFQPAGEHISNYVLDLFVDLVAGSISFSNDLTSHFALTQCAIETLTKDQYRVINFLRSHRRVAISGCAGSGKTLVAAEKALRLDRAGLSTLIVCHNPFLAMYLKDMTRQSGVRVEYFAQWVNRLLNYGLNHGMPWTHFEEPRDDELNTAFDALVNSSERYDAIIIDEGQDFREEWWLLVQAALVDDQFGVLYIFYDDNQALLPFRSKYPLEQAPFSLSRNCRNAGAVFDLVRRFHPQAPETSLHLEGRGVVKQVSYGLGEEQFAITDALRISTELLPLADLVVLTTEPDPAEQSVLSDLQIELGLDSKWQDILLPHLQQLAGYFGQNAAVPILSETPYPTPDDIRAVSAFARRLTINLGSRRSEVHGPSVRAVKWRVDPRGLHLHFTAGLPSLRAFLQSEEWAEDIPRPRLIRISATKNVCSGDEIALSTVTSYKGLESPGVILFIPPGREENETDIYVGISRARLFLCVVAEKKSQGRIFNRRIIDAIAYPTLSV